MFGDAVARPDQMFEELQHEEVLETCRKLQLALLISVILTTNTKSGVSCTLQFPPRVDLCAFLHFLY